MSTGTVSTTFWERGQALRLAGKAAEALGVLRTGLPSESHDYRLHDELGMALSELGRHEEAIGSFLTVISLKPDCDEACNKIGSAFAARGLYLPAVTWFHRARQLNPEGTEYLYPYGHALVMRNSIEEAAAVFEKWTKAEPDNPIAQHLASAALGRQEIKKASPDYVKTLFNSCAARFDDTLARLHYRGPEIVLGALQQTAQPPASGWRIIDAGCGTGLVGAQLRPIAQRLVGVDLSPGMLDMAHGRSVYDELVNEEIIEFLRNHPRDFDVLTAADVLTYLGDLGEFFQAAAAALEPEGIVVVLVEALNGKSNYRLNPTGRFCHSRQYLSDSMRGAGFRVEFIREDSMRHEGGAPTPTLVAVGRKVTQ
jgi:predicted TPR repeat methyltransferase